MADLQNDPELLRAALLGMETQMRQIQSRADDIRRRLGLKPGETIPMLAAVPAPAGKRKHEISAEGRARIAEAQRKRWAKAKRAA